MHINGRLFLLALALSIVPAHAGDDLPPWLKELTGITLPEYPAKVTSVALLNKEHHTAAENGRMVTNTRTAVKYSPGRSATSSSWTITIPVAAKCAISAPGWSLPPARSKKYGKDEIVDVACVENDVYNECRKRAVSGARDAEVGSILACESTIEYESFSNEIAFSLPGFFADPTVPTHRQRGWEIKSASFNGAPAEPPPGAGVYTWLIENCRLWSANARRPACSPWRPGWA
jgi:hypothetical protein